MILVSLGKNLLIEKKKHNKVRHSSVDVKF